ncbi:hypothetical protein [Microbacterium sp. NPDC076895]|uniref:DUF6414 family protein n=1 Tax=Microbacterium sp. NPDC076895 TaxID=3154957 RepID=UPI00342ED7E6
MTFGFRRRAAMIEGATKLTASTLKAGVGPFREFAYLDETSLQSLLVSIVGALPSEITALSSRSTEAELGATAGAPPALLAKAEVTARFKGASASSSQVLSRAVAESLFKNLHELSSDRLVWNPSASSRTPLNLDRGSLIEIDVELQPDPIYGFNATMGVLTDLAEDYPGLLDDPTTAMILGESGPVNKVLERMLVGLIPLKSTALGLRAGIVDGTAVAGTAAYFESLGVPSQALHIVGVTEQEKYRRDVRRVLFSKDRYTILGRISRGGIQPSWVPVKLTEVMRDLAPQFPDAITRVGQVGYSTPVNTREERNEAALKQALVNFAIAIGQEAAEARIEEVLDFAEQLRGQAANLTSQGAAFTRMGEWLVQSGIAADLPSNERSLRSQARAGAGLQASSGARTLADFAGAKPAVDPPTEMLLDLDIVAIYW